MRNLSFFDLFHSVAVGSTVLMMDAVVELYHLVCRGFGLFFSKR